jgi:acetylornithine deacetylase
MEHLSLNNLSQQAIALLQQLIAIPSYSREEDKTADLLVAFMQERGFSPKRIGNNVILFSKEYDASKPTVLLNSHHDTVKPNAAYTRNAFDASVEDGKLYGLGSNDAGGALVSLLATFMHFDAIASLPFNLLYVASAEEEVSGINGIESIIEAIGHVDVAIVGEPTQMQMAVAERGLLVLDCKVTGAAGHVANNVGVNAIYKAMPDIEWFRTYCFEKESAWLGPVNMNVTLINAGKAHNQVPDECTFVVDVRLNECYTHAEVLEVIRKYVSCEVKERSTRIKPSFIEEAHPLVLAGKSIGLTAFGSSTTSDMALMPWKAVKMGPGDTKRSHSADEFIYIHEIEAGIATYIQLLNAYAKQLA